MNPKQARPKLKRLKVSPNRRFLVTGDGKPFFWLADTAWCLRKISPEDREFYMAHRARHGFNVILVYCGYNLNTWIQPEDRAGNRPFLKDDTDTPNEAFWKGMDEIVARAGTHGLYIALIPMWGMEYQAAFGADSSKVFRLGRWLGNRYRAQPHVLWVASGEYSTIHHYTASLTGEQRSLFTAMGRGLREGSEGKALITIHPGLATSSTHFHNEPWLDFNMLQSGHYFDREAVRGQENWSLIAHDYALSPTKPVLDGEPIYEDIIDSVFYIKDMTRPRCGPDVVRRKAYWAVLAGAFGHTYGHNDIQVFQEDPEKPLETSQRHHWKNVMDAPGALQMRHLRSLMESLPFQKGLPDMAMITSEPGQGAARVQASRASDGSYALVYLPSGGTARVNVGKIAGTKVEAAWFDPRTGSTRAIGNFMNQGQRDFTAPGKPEPGNDWILVLKAEGR